MELKKELEQRGFLHQYTSEDVFDLYDQGGQKFYVGMDPSANSLHLGNFVGFMHAVQYMKRGNKLIFIVGGATGMVGDPGGKNAERNFLDEQTLAKNIKDITAQVTSILQNLSGLSHDTFEFEVQNNLDFYEDMSFIRFQREIGKYITVNQMMNKETVKRRIEEPGASISYTEFSYMLMQAFDFLTLFQEQGCKLQIAGSDQRGNVVTGIELIRKKLDQEAYGVTCPLLLDSTGKKFGKSEGNALRLNPTKTTPYEMYQYFLNTADEDVQKFLAMLTLLPAEEIAAIVEQHAQHPEKRYGQAMLAKYVVTTVSGAQAAAESESIREFFFGENNKLEELEKMSDQLKSAVCKATGEVQLPPQEYRVLELLVAAGLAQSNSEAKKLIGSAAISIDEHSVSDIGYMHKHSTQSKYGGTLIRKGKKKYVYVR